MSHASDKSNLLVALEACRPGSDDIDLPEMNEAAQAIADDQEFELLYGRIQQSDTALADAFRDVDPPVGLLNRLLADLELDAEVEVENDKPSAKPTAASGSRRWILSGALAASALIAAGIGFSFWNQPSLITSDQIAASAVNIHGKIAADSWNTSNTAPADRPTFGRLQRDVIDEGWTNVEVLGDDAAVAYRYTRARGTRATLLVFQPATIDPNLPLAPPLNPSHSSGVTVGAWTADGLVYALVVDGGVQQYQGFLRSSSIAMWLKSTTTVPFAS